MGAVGAILAFADPAPTACFEIYQAWKERAREIAREKQDRIAAAAKRVVGQLSVPGVKYALDLNGYYGGLARLPFLPLTAEEKKEVEKLMAGKPLPGRYTAPLTPTMYNKSSREAILIDPKTTPKLTKLLAQCSGPKVKETGIGFPPGSTAIQHRSRASIWG